MLSVASAADNFLNYSGKRRNGSWRALSPFATMISTLFNNHTIIYTNLSYFGLDNFKVDCCIFIVCGKGLNFAIIILTCSSAKIIKNESNELLFSYNFQNLDTANSHCWSHCRVLENRNSGHSGFFHRQSWTCIKVSKGFDGHLAGTRG